MATFGALLRQYRTWAGLGVNEVGRAARVDHTYVSKLEAGVRPPPTRAVVFRLADALSLHGWPRVEFGWAAGYAPDVPVTVTLGVAVCLLPPAESDRSQAAERGTPEPREVWDATLQHFRFAAGEAAE